MRVHGAPSADTQATAPVGSCTDPTTPTATKPPWNARDGADLRVREGIGIVRNRLPT